MAQVTKLWPLAVAAVGVAGFVYAGWRMTRPVETVEVDEFENEAPVVDPGPDEHFEKVVKPPCAPPRAGKNIGKSADGQAAPVGSTPKKPKKKRPERPGVNQPEPACASGGYPLGESNPCPLAENQIS